MWHMCTPFTVTKTTMATWYRTKRKYPQVLLQSFSENGRENSKGQGWVGKNMTWYDQTTAGKCCAMFLESCLHYFRKFHWFSLVTLFSTLMKSSQKWQWLGGFFYPSNVSGYNHSCQWPHFPFCFAGKWDLRLNLVFPNAHCLTDCKLNKMCT